MYNWPEAQINTIQVVWIGNQELSVEVDTSASLSTISEGTYHSLIKATALQPDYIYTYMGEQSQFQFTITTSRGSFHYWLLKEEDQDCLAEIGCKTYVWIGKSFTRYV